MDKELKNNFGISAAYLETNSRNTFQNAEYTAKILKEKNIYTVIVVAQLRDMPRILWSFDKTGIHALSFADPIIDDTFTISDILPSANAFRESYYIFHEMIGLMYYKWEYS